MGDWFPASPSPREFFSSMLSDNVAEQSIINSNKCEASFPGAEGSANSDKKDQSQERVEGDETNNTYASAELQLNYGGGLMERIAARAGFNAPRLNTESIIRSADLSKKPVAQPPLFAVSLGLSPTTLLESPVFLTNSLAWPSPTTGKLLLSSIGNNANATTLIDGYNNKVQKNHCEDANAPFPFQPVASESSASFHYPSAVNKRFPSVSVSICSNTSLPHQSIEPPKVQPVNNSSLFEHTNFFKLQDGSNLFPEQTSNSIVVADQSSPSDEPHEDGDHSTVDPNVGNAPAEDGYSWRKYGQKHVKGCEYPRSYYKCTYPNCPVKKKVERSHEGHITEIIYNGAHNHPKPVANLRSPFGLSNGHSEMQLESEQSGTDASGDPMWSVSQSKTLAGAPDWRTDNPPLNQENSNGTGTQYKAGDAADGSCSFSNDDEDGDRATYGSLSLGNDGEGDDEMESKRRRIETYAPNVGGASTALREPRVVVQTTSEVDILEDGYRWRKYGQKVVKGNPNPRSYYKCTSPGCNVRKHVERASHDLKSVITTYGGKHNHDVPAPRNSGHTNPGVTNQQYAAVDHNIHRPEPSQSRSTTARFGRPPIGSFGIQGRPQLEPGRGFGLGMNQPGLASMGLGGLPVHPYFGSQPRVGNDMRYVAPKGEPNSEPVADISSSSTIGTTVYPQQVMSRFHLGPQI